MARVRNADDGPRSVTQALTLAVSTPLTAAASGPAPASEVGRPFTLALTSTGSLPPTSWSIAGGTAPPGLAVDSATGLLSDTPTAAGIFCFTARATDSLKASSSKTFVLSVRPY